MRNLRVVLLAWLLTSFLSLGVAGAHEPGSYEMNFENFIANADGLETTGYEVAAECHQLNGRFGPFSEVTFGSLHFHKNHNGNFELAENGWLTTLGIRSGAAEYVHHGKAIYPRTTLYDRNEWGEKLGARAISEALSTVFMNVASSGSFEIIAADGLPGNYYRKYKVVNKSVIEDCLF